jgi:cell division septation protein DedD
MEPVLKQRLIGAVVLVALAVIFLPMLIKGPAPDSGVSDVSMKVPDEPAGQFVEIPLTAPGEAPAGGAVGMPAAQPATSVATTPAPQPAVQGMLPATVAGGDYAVSYGAYASASDADTVIARLRQAQLPGFSVADTINGKPAYRVRIGPYADRAQAEIVRLEAVKLRSDVNAQVIALDAAPSPATTTPVAATAPVKSEPLPPAPAKPEPAKPVAVAPKPETKLAPAPAAPKPAASATGFAVQMGAFTDAAQAAALRDSLRGKGFSAFVEKVNTDSGSLSRVRVGPVATREAAEALRAKLGSGQVRPHP